MCGLAITMTSTNPKNQIEYAIGPNLEWNERFSLKNSSIYALDVVERIKN